MIECCLPVAIVVVLSCIESCGKDEVKLVHRSSKDQLHFILPLETSQPLKLPVLCLHLATIDRPIATIVASCNTLHLLVLSTHTHTLLRFTFTYYFYYITTRSWNKKLLALLAHSSNELAFRLSSSHS